MIRPLRQTHRWLLPGLFLLLVIAAVLALGYPTPRGRVDRLPDALRAASAARP